MRSSIVTSTYSTTRRRRLEAHGDKQPRTPEDITRFIRCISMLHPRRPVHVPLRPIATDKRKTILPKQVVWTPFRTVEKCEVLDQSPQPLRQLQHARSGLAVEPNHKPAHRIPRLPARQQHMVELHDVLLSADIHTQRAQARARHHAVVAHLERAERLPVVPDALLRVLGERAEPEDERREVREAAEERARLAQEHRRHRDDPELAHSREEGRGADAVAEARARGLRRHVPCGVARAGHLEVDADAALPAAGRVCRHEGEALVLDAVGPARVWLRRVAVVECAEVQGREGFVEREPVEGLLEFVGQDRGESDDAVGGELEMGQDGAPEVRAEVRMAISLGPIGEGLFIRKLAQMGKLDGSIHETAVVYTVERSNIKSGEMQDFQGGTSREEPEEIREGVLVIRIGIEHCSVEDKVCQGWEVVRGDEQEDAQDK